MRVIITGASRGIGAAIAKCFAARNGNRAQIALLGRSLSEPSHADLEGTLLETARDVEACGSTALPYSVDMRDASALVGTLRTAVHTMGGVDVLINNASALYVKPVASSKHMDLVHAVNSRGTMICLDECRNALTESETSSIVTLSPPVRVGRHDWVRDHVPYTLSKYSMTLATLAAASKDVRANCIWPRYTAATAATRMLENDNPGIRAYSQGRDPYDVAQAVYALAVDKTEYNARCFMDDEVITMPPTSAPLDLFVQSEQVTHSME